MCSAWFPPGDPPVGHALPSTGSSGASSPASTVVWRGATPCLPFAALRCLRLAIPGGASEVSLPSVPNARPRARGSSSGPLYRQCPPGDGQGIPSSWRTSIVCLPCSSTPAGLRAPDQYGVAAWPLVCEQQRLPQRVFRRSIAWLSDSLSTLRRAGYPVRRKTRFRSLVRHCRTGFHPQGSNGRFQSASGISSSSPKLCLAQTHRPKYRIVWLGGDENRVHPPCKAGDPKGASLSRYPCHFPCQLSARPREGLGGDPVRERPYTRTGQAMR